MKTLSAYAVTVPLLVLTGCYTPLVKASAKGDLAAVQDLLAKGAKVNESTGCDSSACPCAIDNGAATPLVCAVAANHLDVAKLLLDKGADVNQRGFAPATYYALSNRNPDMLKLLIDKRADLSVKFYPHPWSGTESLLTVAAERGTSDMIKILLDAAADRAAAIDEAISILKGQIASSPDSAEPRTGLELLERLAKREGLALKSDEGVAPAKESSAPAQETDRGQSASATRSDVDEPPATSARTNKKAYAIVIGVERHRQQMPKADFAAHDAQVVSEYLTKALGYPEENVVTLLDDKALKSDLEKYFEKWLANNVESGGTVFVYYSGHGAPDPASKSAYLVPYDGDPSFIDQTGYPLKRMYAALEKLPAREVIVALDSCFSGAGGRSVIAKGLRPLVMKLETLVPASNMTIMTAAAGEQTSSTYDEKGHGLFTYFMLKGIRNEDVTGQDGSLRIDDLFDYIKPRVERIARKKYNNEQSPQLTAAKKP